MNTVSIGSTRAVGAAHHAASIANINSSKAAISAGITCCGCTAILAVLV